MPARIETARVVMRPWRRTDAPLLKAVIEGNLEHLRACVPWSKESTALRDVEQRIDKFDRAFRSESEWLYAIFSAGESHLLGGAGLHRSSERGAVEVSFWIAESWTKQGFATEATRALAEHAMRFPNVQRVQIRCEASNAGASGVARRAGFRHASTVKSQVFERGTVLPDTMVWELSNAVAVKVTAPPKPGVWSAIRSFLSGRN